jgi:hypothetical protein
MPLDGNFAPGYGIIDLKFGELTTVSLEDDFESSTIFAPCPSVAVQGIYSGNPQGTLFIEYPLNKIDWDTLGSSTILINGQGNTIWDLSQVSVPFMRLSYTRVTGTGVLSAKAYGKGIL